MQFLFLYKLWGVQVLKYSEGGCPLFYFMGNFKKGAGQFIAVSGRR